MAAEYLRPLVESGIDVLHSLKDRRKLRYMMPDADCQMVPLEVIDQAIAVIVGSIRIMKVEGVPLTKSQSDFLEAICEDVLA